jgi:hypothetical protein
MELQIIRRKVKRARITISGAGEVKVVVPLRFPEAMLRSFLKEREDWIKKHLERFQKNRIPLRSDEFLYLGKPMRPSLFEQGDEEWLLAEARRHISQRTKELAAEHGFSYNRITIRDARTRWGSCSQKKNLSFSWRLIKAPEFVIDYLILHELAHTVHMNHSKRYWALVERICPAYEKAEKWLKMYGHNTH